MKTSPIFLTLSQVTSSIHRTPRTAAVYLHHFGKIYTQKKKPTSPFQWNILQKTKLLALLNLQSFITINRATFQLLFSFFFSNNNRAFFSTAKSTFSPYPRVADAMKSWKVNIKSLSKGKGYAKSIFFFCNTTKDYTQVGHRKLGESETRIFFFIWMNMA